MKTIIDLFFSSLRRCETVKCDKKTQVKRMNPTGEEISTNRFEKCFYVVFLGSGMIYRHTIKHVGLILIIFSVRSIKNVESDWTLIDTEKEFSPNLLTMIH